MTDLEYKRKTDNEAVFRRYNEAVTDGLDNLVEVAAREGWSQHVSDVDDPLHFYCECSREDCHQRILVVPSEYARIHENRKRFTLQCGHETPSVEKVIRRTKRYCVVEKFSKPDEDAKTLKKTDLSPVDEL